MKLRNPVHPSIAHVRARIDGGLAFFRRIQNTRRVVAMRHEIEEDQRTLLTFGDGTSGEFNGIAESLAELSAGLGEVRTQAGKLDSILQDHDEDRALFSAFELYKKSVDLAHGSIGLALSQEEQMEQMEGRLLQDRGHFAQTSVMFRLLVMHIRTEAARIDPENRATFSSVAEEIDVMARQMNSTVEVAFSELEAIVIEAAAGRVKLHELQVDLHDRAQSSMKSLRAALDKIKTGLAPCAVASGEITALLEKTRSQTSDLITSLQYQDIVRQQLEHVGQGFEDMERHLTPAGVRHKIDLGYVHHATRIQQKHLSSSRDAIEKAGAAITEGSQALLATGATLVEGLASLERSADAVFRNSNVAALFKRETENLVQIAGMSEATNHRITRLLERIEKSVRVFSTEIRRHEFEVQLVALNAQIAASRAPDAGALVKLAEETANLSWHTATLTRAMSVQLAETLTRLQAIRTEAGQVHLTVSREKADIAQNSIVVGNKLAALSERIQQSSGDVILKFSTAYQRVRDLLPSLRFPSLVAACYGPAEDLCDRLLSATVGFAEVTVGTEGAERLAAHHSRYTMREEREAHSAAIAQSPPTDPSPKADSTEAIELFSEEEGSTSPVPATASEVAPASVPPAENHGEGIELF